MSPTLSFYRRGYITSARCLVFGYGVQETMRWGLGRPVLQMRHDLTVSPNAVPTATMAYAPDCVLPVNAKCPAVRFGRVPCCVPRLLCPLPPPRTNLSWPCPCPRPEQLPRAQDTEERICHGLPLQSGSMGTFPMTRALDVLVLKPHVRGPGGKRCYILRKDFGDA